MVKDIVSICFAGVAAVVSIVSLTISWRMLLIEKQRDKELMRKIERAEASRVLVSGIELPDRKNQKWGIYLNNFSTEPVFNVSVESKHLKGTTANPTLYSKYLPPGEYLVLPDPQYKWGFLPPSKTFSEYWVFVARTEQSMITKVSYCDLEDIKWIKNENDRHPHHLSDKARET